MEEVKKNFTVIDHDTVKQIEWEIVRIFIKRGISIGAMVAFLQRTTKTWETVAKFLGYENFWSRVETRKEKQNGKN